MPGSPAVFCLQDALMELDIEDAERYFLGGYAQSQHALTVEDARLLRPELEIFHLLSLEFRDPQFQEFQCKGKRLELGNRFTIRRMPKHHRFRGGSSSCSRRICSQQGVWSRPELRSRRCMWGSIWWASRSAWKGWKRSLTTNSGKSRIGNLNTSRYVRIQKSRDKLSNSLRGRLQLLSTRMRRSI